MIFKTPKQVRPQELGRGKFATGRTEMPTLNPQLCNMLKHRNMTRHEIHERHERREHRGRY